MKAVVYCTIFRDVHACTQHIATLTGSYEAPHAPIAELV